MFFFVFLLPLGRMRYIKITSELLKRHKKNRTELGRRTIIEKLLSRLIQSMSHDVRAAALANLLYHITYFVYTFLKVLWQVTGAMRHLTPDTRHLTPDTGRLTPNFFLSSSSSKSVLLSAHMERLRVSCMLNEKKFFYLIKLFVTTWSKKRILHLWIFFFFFYFLATILYFLIDPV